MSYYIYKNLFLQNIKNNIILLHLNRYNLNINYLIFVFWDLKNDLKNAVKNAENTEADETDEVAEGECKHACKHTDLNKLTENLLYFNIMDSNKRFIFFKNNHDVVYKVLLIILMAFYTTIGFDVCENPIIYSICTQYLEYSINTIFNIYKYKIKNPTFYNYRDLMLKITK